MKNDKFALIFYLPSRIEKMIIVTIFLFFCANFLLTSCEIPEDINYEFKETFPSQKDQECPQLDNQLYQLTKSESPITKAEELGFEVRDNKIQVLLILVDEEATLPKGFNIDVGIRSGAKVNVYAPMDELCELANNDTIIAIYPPERTIIE